MRSSVLRGLAIAIPMIMLGASSASAAPAGSDEICGARQGQLYGRTLWGLCTAAVAAECDVQPEAQRCEQLESQWRRADFSQEPPWLEPGCVAGGTCTVFVTSTTTNGNLAQHYAGSDGLAGGDAFCQARADADEAEVPAGVYRAWLSTIGVDDVNAKTRVLDATYLRPDGELVAKDLDDLTDGSIKFPIIIDEFSNAIPAWPNSGLVYTGTSSRGIVISSENCSNWTRGVSVSRGWVTKPDEWGSGAEFLCNGEYRLYCFQVE